MRVCCRYYLVTAAVYSHALAMGLYATIFNVAKKRGNWTPARNVSISYNKPKGPHKQGTTRRSMMYQTLTDF
jgi:hypothetical protein